MWVLEGLNKNPHPYKVSTFRLCCHSILKIFSVNLQKVEMLGLKGAQAFPVIQLHFRFKTNQTPELRRGAKATGIVKRAHKGSRIFPGSFGKRLIPCSLSAGRWWVWNRVSEWTFLHMYFSGSFGSWEAGVLSEGSVGAAFHSSTIRCFLLGGTLCSDFLCTRWQSPKAQSSWDHSDSRCAGSCSSAVREGRALLAKPAIRLFKFMEDALLIYLSGHLSFLILIGKRSPVRDFKILRL